MKAVSIASSGDGWCDHQQVVASLLICWAPLTAYGIDADEGALEVECVEQFQDGGDFIAFSGDLLLVENGAKSGGGGSDHVDRALAFRRRSAGRFAIDHKGATQGADDACDPAQKGHLEHLRVEHAKDAETCSLFSDGIPFLSTMKRRSQATFARPESDVFDGCRNPKAWQLSITKIS